MTVRLRFAPSPTGFLHVGGARTALFNYFYAKHHGGKFILRIEDTDTERNKPEFEEEILRSMKWLGLNWDEGPFYQTKRFDVYRSYVQKLLDGGKAYRCFCTAAEIDVMRAEATAAGKKPQYNRKCRERKDEGAGPFVIRFKTPLSGEVIIQDGIKGEVRFANQECDDFVILRSNNTPIYNLTVVVDDIDMKITDVIRAEEHLNNTPKQFLLMEALGFTPPRYAHVPLVLAPDKTKLSKRHGAVAVSQFCEEGYLPEAMVSYLSRLGWSHGDQETFTFDELIKFFDLANCGTSGSVFDRAKLDWVNAHFIKQKSPQEIGKLVMELYKVDLGPMLATASGAKLMKALTERAIRLKDFVNGTHWYFTDQIEKDPHLVETVLKVANPEAMPALATAIEGLGDADWTSEKIGSLFKETATKLGLKMPDLAKPARVLLTGPLASPDIGLVVEVLGKERALKRLRS